MKCKSCRIVLLAVFMLTVTLSTLTAYAVAPAWMIRPGTVGHALSLEDGTHVYLDAVVVDKIKAQQSPAYFTVRECFNRNDRIIVLTQPSPELRMGMILDVEGTLTTLPNGSRVITNPAVYGYTDEDGNILRHGPLVKGPTSPTPWQWKTNLTVASAAPFTDITEEPNTDPAEAPSYYSEIADILTESTQTEIQSLQSMRMETSYSSIPEVIGLPDGSLVELQCKRITAVGTETINGIVYDYLDIAEDAPATDTIRAYYTGSVDITDRINRITGQIRHIDPNTPVICVDNGPAYDPQVLEGQLQTASQGTIAWAKTFSNGTTLPVALENKVVSRSYPSSGYFYIQEPLRSSGIRVYNQNATQSVQPGSTVSMSGILSSQNGERMLTPGSVTITGAVNQPKPLGLSNKLLGGGAFNTYTPGITGSSETNNVGLLARIYGKVTSTGSNYFYLEDGTGVNNGVGNPTGVKVSWAWDAGNPPIVAPEENWFVSATGASSSEIVDQSTVRVLRLRSQKDLQVINPIDDADPSVDITSPSGDEIHIAPSATSIQLAGTATDVDTGITSVQVGFTVTGSAIPPTTWYTASYNSTTYIWTYNWQSPQTQKVWVKATDFAGHSAVTSCEATRLANVIYVDITRPNDTGNGQSWGTAKRTVQAAINAASSGTEIWIATGTYTECITMKSGVSLFGGFSGSELYRQQRNWNNNKTILKVEDYYDPVIQIEDASACVVDGFAITNGGAWRGAIYCYNATDTTIANNIILRNNENGLRAEWSTLTVVGNVFVDNSAENGGGIYYMNTGGQIVNNTIICNSAYVGGGGINLSDCPASLAVSNNIVAYNVGGGIHRSGTTSPTFTKNVVYGNVSVNYSGITPIPATDIQSDPKIPYIGSGDWHIAGDSPCRNQGVTVSDLPYTDIDGESRVYDSTVDIGADEWNGSEPTPVTPLMPIIFVKPSGDDINNGESWANAVKSVQKGIELACNTASREVWVAAGTYTKNAGDTTVATISKNFVKLYGGFPVGATSKSDRNWNTNPTILDGGRSGSVILIRDVSGCAVDGFIITNGGGTLTSGAGIRCIKATNTTIANNIIRENLANALVYGGGLYAEGSILTVAGNTFVDNYAGYGGGIFCTNTSGQIANNTIVKNNGNSSAGGILTASCSPTIVNNIIALNSSGIAVVGTLLPTLKNNCVYNPGGINYSGISPGNNDKQEDPKFAYAANGDFHIWWGSPCRDAGDGTVFLPIDVDMDCEARKIGTIDIGADETTACYRYRVTLTSEVVYSPMGDPVTIRAYVHDLLIDGPAVGYRVDFSISDGEIVSISNDGHINNPPTSGYGTTNADGIVEATITRSTYGRITITGSILQCSKLQVDKTDVIFFDPALPVNIVFCIDVTGSTDGGTKMKEGLKATVDYLYTQLQAQGRMLRIAGIKFSDYYPNRLDPSLSNSYGELRNFTNMVDASAVTAFKDWVDNPGLGGGLEYQLDILMFAKDMAPGAVPGLYIALATDEGTNSTLDKAVVVNALAASGSIVFIDPASSSLATYYNDLAANGGAIETNINSFTFPLMRQAILGQ